MLLVTPDTSFLGGIQRYNQRLAAALPKVTSSHHHTMPLNETRSRSLIEGLKFTWVLLRLRPRVVVLAYVTFGPLGWFSRLLGIPYIVETYGVEVWRSRSRWTAMALRWGSATWTISSFTAAALARFYPEAAPVVTVGGVVDDQFFDIEPARSDHLIVLTVARLDDLVYKGIDTCLDAVARLPGDMDVEYRIVGRGEAVPQLREVIRRRGLSGRVTVLDNVDDIGLHREYARADVTLLMTRYREGACAMGEGLGLVLLEGAAAGLTAIGSSPGGAECAVIHGVTGYLVPGGDPERLAEVIARLACDRDLCNAMGQRGKQWAWAQHSEQAFLKRLSVALEGY